MKVQRPLFSRIHDTRDLEQPLEVVDRDCPRVMLNRQDAGGAELRQDPTDMDRGEAEGVGENPLANGKREGLARALPIALLAFPEFSEEQVVRSSSSDAGKG